MFARSDAISLHLAYATAKHGIIGRDAISGMKPGALLVNMARAHLVDETAMLETT